MAEKPSGRADKYGNTYERLWVTKQALLVLEGRTHRSIYWEPLGDDERGVDVWIERTDGTREAHQCKRENGSKKRWTVAELAARGVLPAAKEQLSRDPRYRFVFVSADSAPYVTDLTTRTHSCNDDPQLFLAHQVDTADRKQTFVDICGYWGLDRWGDVGGGALARSWANERAEAPAPLRFHCST